MSNELEVLKNSQDQQQQYYRRNCVVIHGISEQKGEDTDEQALKIIREELGETAEKSDLDQTHRIGAFKEDKSKCTPIIVKFSRYNVRDKVFKNKKKLKGKVYSITESLTAMKIKSLLKHAIALVSPTCGLKTGKFYVRKTTESRFFLTNCTQRSHLEVFLKNSYS